METIMEKLLRILNKSQPVSVSASAVSVSASDPAPVSTQPPKSTPAPDPFEVGPEILFCKLDAIKDKMTFEQTLAYSRLKRHFEEDHRTGVSITWGEISFLRGLYQTYYYRR